MDDRRSFIKKGSLGLMGAAVLSNKSAPFSNLRTLTTNRAPKLNKGDLIAIIAPGGAIFSVSYIEKFENTLHRFGFKTTVGRSVHQKFGQFAGYEQDRAKEIMGFFKDPEVKAIIGMRGGSGAARILTHLDFETIAENPKIIMGFSDITSTINAIYAKTGLITYHGPVGYSSWGDFTYKSFKRMLVNPEKGILPLHTSNRPKTIYGGTASGQLIGGNLTVFTTLVGTPYMPNCKDAILVLEEIDEEPYAIDRMLVQLKQAGILDQLNGMILGDFKHCKPEEPEKSLSLGQTFELNLMPLKIPIFSGAPFGHTTHKWTLPIGAKVSMDADKFELNILDCGVI